MSRTLLAAEGTRARSGARAGARRRWLALTLAATASLAVGLGAEAAPLYVSGQVWQVHQARTDLEGNTTYWTADFPALQFRAWTPLAGGLVGGLRLTSTSSYTFRDGNGDPMPGYAGNYGDWALSLGRAVALAPGSRVDVRLAYEEQTQRINANDGSWVRYRIGGLVVGADLSMRLAGNLTAYGQLSLLAAGRANYDDSDNIHASTRAEGTTVRLGAIYETGGLSLEGGYQMQTTTALASADWNPAIRIGAAGPYVGLRARF